MDAGKEYEKNQKKAKKRKNFEETAIYRLSRPYRLYGFYPMYIVINIVMRSMIDKNISFTDMLLYSLSPVSLAVTAVFIVLGIKFDQDSRLFWQAVCAPVENINMKYVKHLDYIRTKTGYTILIFTIIAAFLLIRFTAPQANLSLGAALMTFQVWDYVSDGDTIIRKLERELAEKDKAA